MVKIACNCGGSKSAQIQYEVKTARSTYTVGTVAEAKIKIAVDGGGTYKAVPKP